MVGALATMARSLLVLGVEDAQRVAFELLQAVVRQLRAVGAEVTDQGAPIVLPAFLVAEGVDLQHRLAGDT